MPVTATALRHYGFAAIPWPRMLAGVKSVIAPELSNEQGVIRDLVNDAVFFVNSAGAVY